MGFGKAASLRPSSILLYCSFVCFAMVQGILFCAWIRNPGRPGEGVYLPILLKKSSGKLPLLVKASLIQKISDDTARKPHRRQQLSDLRRRAAAFTRNQPVRYDDLCCQKIWVFNVVDGLVGGFHAELVGIYIHGGQLRAGNA